MRHRFSPRARAAFVSVAVALFTAAATATGQTEAGIARDTSTQAPLACVHVALLDSAGTAVRHGVTDSLGQFYLDAPKPGAYRVRFETSGWAPLDGPLDTLAEVDFRQRTYEVAFTNLLRPFSLDSLPHRLIPWNKRFDRTWIDSAFAPRRRLSEEARRREESSGWTRRRLRWTPSSNAGQPVCDLVQYLVRFELDDRDPDGRTSVIVIMNE